MILSFHPIIEAHQNIICAGRKPDENDLAAIKQADAVILPQGCYESLYRMARLNCPHVFPNIDVRFDYPGKRGQIQLFQKIGADHPKTESYHSLASFRKALPGKNLPIVVKLDWGGQGDTVFKINDIKNLEKLWKRLKAFESTGQYGFIVQDYISHQNRSLRVAVIGTRFFSYWRHQPDDNTFGTSVADGANIDHVSDSNLQAAAKIAAKRLCSQTGLQLAGIDYIFNDTTHNENPMKPLILEINYYFGRDGLGGSEKYYELLTDAVDKWLSALSLSRLQSKT